VSASLKLQNNSNLLEITISGIEASLTLPFFCQYQCL